MRTGKGYRPASLCLLRRALRLQSENRGNSIPEAMPNRLSATASVSGVFLGSIPLSDNSPGKRVPRESYKHPSGAKIAPLMACLGAAF